MHGNTFQACPVKVKYLVYDTLKIIICVFSSISYLEVPDEPLCVEDVLGWHPEPHNCVEERLSLSGVEPEHLDVSTHAGKQWRQRSVVLSVKIVNTWQMQLRSNAGFIFVQHLRGF